MSSRNLRRVLGSPAIPSDSEEEFAPVYSNHRTAFTFGMSSDSDTSSDEQESSDDGEASVAKIVNRKNKRKMNTKQVPDEDEVDRSVREVNELLGVPVQDAPEVKRLNMNKFLFTVVGKHLNCENEMKRRFGVEPSNLNRHQPAKNVTRAFIVPPITGKSQFKPSWDVTLMKTDDRGNKHFLIEHHNEYQEAHKRYIKNMKTYGTTVIDVENLRKILHIEGLIDYSDFMFRVEEYTPAKNVLEMIISYFQYKMHIQFNWSDQRCQLPYEYTSNRPLLITLLRYLYIVSNKACHRTALEIGKLLLNLDPTDPLGVSYVLDAMALRAREYNWLVSYVDYWTTRAVCYSVLNLKYSYALAHYHLSLQTAEKDHAKPNALLQDAIVEFPYFAKVLLQEVRPNETSLIRHALFSEDRMTFGGIAYSPSDTMKIAVKFLVKNVAAMWREPEILKWFIDTTTDLLRRFDSDSETRRWSHYVATQNIVQNMACPAEMLRHLHVMRHMSQHLIQWRYPELPYFTPVFDPHPLPEINHDIYEYQAIRPRDQISYLYTMFSTIMPGPQDVQYYNR